MNPLTVSPHAAGPTASAGTAHTASAASGGPGAHTRGRRVTDLATRTWHWLTAVCFVGAYLSAESEKWRLVHATLGYVLVGLLAWRLWDGWRGPRQMSLTAMARKLRAWPDWWQALRTAVAARQWWAGPLWRQAYPLGMATVVLTWLVVLAALLLSGTVVYEAWLPDGASDGLADIHGWLGDAAWALVGLHVAWLTVASMLRRQNLAGPMLNGRLPGKGPDLVQNNRTATAWALVVTASAGAGAYLLWILYIK